MHNLDSRNFPQCNDNWECTKAETGICECEEVSKKMRTMFANFVEDKTENNDTTKNLS